MSQLTYGGHTIAEVTARFLDGNALLPTEVRDLIAAAEELEATRNRMTILGGDVVVSERMRADRAEAERDQLRAELDKSERERIELNKDKSTLMEHCTSLRADNERLRSALIDLMNDGVEFEYNGELHVHHADPDKARRALEDKE